MKQMQLERAMQTEAQEKAARESKRFVERLHRQWEPVKGNARVWSRDDCEWRSLPANGG